MEIKDVSVVAIAAAIGEPARARMLFCLMDSYARTSTELSVVAEVSPSTASAHLTRLKAAGLVSSVSQGKHRYYRLHGPQVAAALESLSVLAGGAGAGFIPNTPTRLRAARTCYDHMAGRVGVFLHDGFTSRGWLVQQGDPEAENYTLSVDGAQGFTKLGVDIPECLARRRRFACPCLDWSERRPHLGGALGRAVLQVALDRQWVTRDLDSRALSLTVFGQRELSRRFGPGLGDLESAG
jgi:DNA-binding transcriptional ArsR family regulator